MIDSSDHIRFWSVVYSFESDSKLSNAQTIAHSAELLRNGIESCCLAKQKLSVSQKRLSFIFDMHSNLILQSLHLYLHYICHFSFGWFWCRSRLCVLNFLELISLSIYSYTNVRTHALAHSSFNIYSFIYLFRWYWIHYTYICYLFMLFLSCFVDRRVEPEIGSKLIYRWKFCFHFMWHTYSVSFCVVFCLLFLYVPRKNSLDNNTTNKKKGKFNWKTFVWMCQLPCMWNELLPKHRALNTMRLCRLLFLLWFSEFSPSL